MFQACDNALFFRYLQKAWRESEKWKLHFPARRVHKTHLRRPTCLGGSLWKAMTLPPPGWGQAESIHRCGVFKDMCCHTIIRLPPRLRQTGGIKQLLFLFGFRHTFSLLSLQQRTVNCLLYKLCLELCFKHVTRFHLRPAVWPPGAWNGHILHMAL